MIGAVFSAFSGTVMSNFTEMVLSKLLLRASSFLLFFLSLFGFISLAIFGKSQVLWLDRGTKTQSIIYTFFEGCLYIALGIGIWFYSTTIM